MPFAARPHRLNHLDDLDDDDPRAVALDVLRASGRGVLRGRLVVPTSRLTAFARAAFAKTRVVESIEIVPGDGEARVHLVVDVLGGGARVALRVALRVDVASFHLACDASGRVKGKLRLRLLEPPTIAGRHGGRRGGVLGVLGAVGEAATRAMGPAGLVGMVADFLGPPVSAHDDVLVVDLASIRDVREAFARATPWGRVGELVHVTGARFSTHGVEVAVAVRPSVAARAARARLEAWWRVTWRG